MAEQEDLEHQLNNVSDEDLLLGGDDGSELEESELSVSRIYRRRNLLRMMMNIFCFSFFILLILIQFL